MRTTGGSWASGLAKLAARAAAVMLGPLVGGCTALGVTDVTGAVDAADAGVGAGMSGDAPAPDGAMARGDEDAGADSTTVQSADAALDSTMGDGAGCMPGAPALCGGNTCVDTTTSADHCGSCTTVCTTADPHAQPACVRGGCTATCNAGYIPCAIGCVDAQTDEANCGACGKACTGTIPVCWMGACVACIPASTRCAGAVPQSDSVQACGSDGKWDGAVTPCAPFACGATACKSTCATDADCSAGNFCWNGACVRVAQIAAGGSDHTCALTTAGAVQCWGPNVYGELGDGTLTNRLVPVAVSGLPSGVSAVAPGASGYTCALTMTGGVQCWGYNLDGELGDGTVTNRLLPVAVSGLPSGISAIAAGSSHACALTTAGGVQCWGNNPYGALGDGTVTNRLVPVAVSALPFGVSAIAAGAGHTCALTTAGAVQCWGYNLHGELGDGTLTNRLVPVAVSGLPSGVSAIAAGAAHTCALTMAGAVQCWGYNGYGELGDGTWTNRLVPVAVSGLPSGVSAIAAGSDHTCALTTAGGVQCWGNNHEGELGDGTMTNRLVPVAVSGLPSGVSAIAAGFSHACALMTAGGVQCWGLGGELGDGTMTSRLVPGQVVEP